MAQICDPTIYEIIEKGLEGNGLDEQEICQLYALPEDSREAALLRWAGQKLTKQCNDGLAEIHAQIGLNATTCPKNCKFCSFAACNSARKGRFELSKEEVVKNAQIFEEDGANVILLLTTASYKFDKLIEMCQAVRAVISPDMPLLVNTEDMTREQAFQLKDAGVQGCYHAVRMREGIDTGIPVEERMQTFEHMRAAGLKLSTCVEPVGPEHSVQEIVEATLRCISTDPLTAGIARRVAVPGTLLYERGMLTDLANANMVAVYRLASGTSLRLNCSANTALTASAGANLAWAEMGSNPRDAVERTEHGGRGASIDFQRRSFQAGGCEVRVGPSPGWFD